MSTKIRNLAHDLIAVVGLLLAAQAPFTAWLVQAGAPARAIGLGFGALGLVAALGSKHIDSRSYTTLAVNAPSVASNAARTLGLLGTLQQAVPTFAAAFEEFMAGQGKEPPAAATEPPPPPPPPAQPTVPTQATVAQSSTVTMGVGTPPGATPNG